MCRFIKRQDRSIGVTQVPHIVRMREIGVGLLQCGEMDHSSGPMRSLPLAYFVHLQATPRLGGH